MCATLADAVRCSRRSVRRVRLARYAQAEVDAVRTRRRRERNPCRRSRWPDLSRRPGDSEDRQPISAPADACRDRAVPGYPAALARRLQCRCENRRFLFGAASRVFWLKAMIVLVFCVGLVMSSRLWIGPRTFRLASALSFCRRPSVRRTCSFMRRSSSWRARSWFRRDRRSSSSAFWASSSSSVSWIRPAGSHGFINIGFLLAALALFSWDSDDVEGRERALNMARLIVATTYIFSASRSSISISSTMTFHGSWNRSRDVFHRAQPSIRVGNWRSIHPNRFRPGIADQKISRVSLILAISMHVFILAMFGPFGHDWNNIIWPWPRPWRASIFCFSLASAVLCPRHLFGHRYPYHVGVLVLFAVLLVAQLRLICGTPFIVCALFRQSDRSNNLRYR